MKLDFVSIDTLIIAKANMRHGKPSDLPLRASRLRYPGHP
jgi:hypothetical protein